MTRYQLDSRMHGHFHSAEPTIRRLWVFAVTAIVAALNMSCSNLTSTQKLLDASFYTSPLVLKTDYARISTGSNYQIQILTGNPPYSYKIAAGSGNLDSFGNFTAPITSGSSIVEVRDSVGNTKNITIYFTYASSTPSVVSGLMRWYKFDSISTGGATGNLVDYSSQNSPAIQGTPANQPIFINDSGKYALEFDSALSQFMTFDGTFLVNSSYTIFLAVKFTDTFTANNFYLAGTSTTSFNNLQIGFRPNRVFTMDIYSMEAVSTASSAAANGQFFFITARLEKTTGTYHNATTFLNEKILALTSFSTTLVSYPGSAIGRNVSSVYLKGRIYEIAMFNKALTDPEVNSVLCYLSDKFGPKLSTCS